MLDSSWGDTLRPLRPHLRFVIWNTLLVTALGILLAVVLPRKYTATATILPPSEEQTGLSMSSLLRGLTIPGVRTPLTVTPSDMVLSVLDSDRIRSAVARRIDPRTVYGIKDSLDAREKLRKNSRFSVTPLGLVEVRVVAPTAQNAADLCNSYIEELDRFTRSQRMTRGHRVRVFIEQRVADERAILDSLGKSVSAFQKANRAAPLSPSAATSVDASARLYAERLNARFQLDLARTYASDNSQEVRTLETRLEALDKQLDQLPHAGMEMARMTRDLKAHEQAYGFLTAQYEDARIEEARDVVAFDVLDRAVPPRKASWPRKRYFGLGAFAIGLLGSLAWVGLGRSGPAARP